MVILIYFGIVCGAKLAKIFCIVKFVCEKEWNSNIIVIFAEKFINMATKKLYRSNVSKMIGGVCGGIGEYFDIDPTIVRLAWVFVALWGGIGLLAYLISWMVIPLNPNYYK